MTSQLRYCMPIIAALFVSPRLDAGAGVAEQTVYQKGRMFSVDLVTVARAERIVFLNDDTVPHNIMSTSVENGFDLGSQVPGTATPVSFSIAGTVVVICAIHPRMRMTIKVTD